MKLNPETMARASSRRPWTTVIVWVGLGMVAGFLSSQYLGDALSTDVDFTDEPSSKLGERLLEERLRGVEPLSEFVVVTSDSVTALDTEYQTFVAQLQSAILGLGPETVTTVGSFLDQNAPVSTDGRTALLPVLLNTTDIDVAGDSATLIREVIADTPAPPDTEALLAGEPWDR